MRALLAWATLFVSAAFCQNVPEVGPTNGPPPRGFTTVNFYNGSSQIIYQCIAVGRGMNYSTLPAVSAATNANPVALTITGHGLDVNATPQVTISGGTGGWAGINKTWTATLTDANTMTVPFDSSAAGSFAGQTLKVTTYSPRLTIAQWAIRKFLYDGSGNTTEVLWANGTTGANQICNNRASLSYQ